MQEKNYDDLMKQYPILFCQKDKSMQETCMCWGIECGIGWYEPLNDLCNKLETLNKDYKKYHIQIQAQQVKEKFGGLHFYYNVYHEKSLMEKIYLFPFELIKKLLNKLDYDTYIEKTPDSNEEKWEEISKEDYDAKKTPTLKNDFGWKFKEEDGKYYRNQCVYHPVKIKFIAKKHKFLFKIKDFCNNVKYFKISQPSKKRVEKANLLYELSENLIDKCEKKCWNTCERCGEENNFEETNIITTSGWISRICKKCSQKNINFETFEYDKNHPDNKYHGIDRITLFREGYSFLNFYESNKSFKYKDKYYASLPHAYFSIKFPDFIPLYNDLVKSAKNNSSYLIEVITEKFKNVSYDKNDYDLLKDITKAKFSDEYNKELRNDLLSTGDKMLINMNGYCSNVLGICFCEKCKLEKGDNIYGKILMEIRNELK